MTGIGYLSGGIVHDTDTGDAKPTKARMHHTPIDFQAEEEKPLEKLLKTGVIQPSISDWASALVLIWKKGQKCALLYRLQGFKCKDC